MTRDGENVSKFHELCDNQGPTLAMFSTKENKIGGLFTLLSWDNSSGSKSDKETFIFDLNKKAKYNKVNNGQSIYCNSNYGPYTCNFGFESSMKRVKHGGKYINKTFEEGSLIFSNDLNGTKYFEIEEVEIEEETVPTGIEVVVIPFFILFMSSMALLLIFHNRRVADEA